MDPYLSLVILVSLLVNCSSGKPQNFKPHEIQAINKLRDAVNSKLKLEYMKSDSYIHKWLKAKNFNHAEALEALEEALEWRKQENIDNLPFEDVGDLKKRLVVDFTSTTDKYGQPVLLMPYADWDIRKAAVAGRINKVTRWLDNMEEKSAQLAFNLTGDPTSMLLVEVNGYTLRKHACIGCLPIYVTWVTHHERYYPYNWYKILIFNAPSILNPVINLMRPYMTQSTREAFKVYDHDKAVWQAVIAETVDLSKLLIRFGGTKKGNPVV